MWWPRIFGPPCAANDAVHTTLRGLRICLRIKMQRQRTTLIYSRVCKNISQTMALAGEQPTLFLNTERLR